MSQMFSPPHPGQLLKEEVLPGLGITVTEAASQLGVTRVAFSRIINGKAGISPDMALRLADWLNSTPESWLKMQAAYDLWHAKQKQRSPFKALKGGNMSLQNIFNRFSNTLYIRVGLNQITGLRLSDGLEATSGATKTFANARLAIADFETAKQMLLDIVKQLKNFGMAPIIVMHQTVFNEGGLSSVERHILRDLALVAGARDAYIWHGKELSVEEFRELNLANLDNLEG